MQGRKVLLPAMHELKSWLQGFHMIHLEEQGGSTNVTGRDFKKKTKK